MTLKVHWRLQRIRKHFSITWEQILYYSSDTRHYRLNQRDDLMWTWRYVESVCVMYTSCWELLTRRRLWNAHFAEKKWRQTFKTSFLKLNMRKKRLRWMNGNTEQEGGVSVANVLLNNGNPSQTAYVKERFRLMDCQITSYRGLKTLEELCWNGVKCTVFFSQKEFKKQQPVLCDFYVFKFELKTNMFLDSCLSNGCSWWLTVSTWEMKPMIATTQP